MRTSEVEIINSEGITDTGSQTRKHIDGIVDDDKLDLEESQTSGNSHAGYADASVLRKHTRDGKGQHIYEGFNTIRNPSTSFNYTLIEDWSRLSIDWFHYLIERATWKIMIIISALYVALIIFFALIWFAVNSEEGDPCHLEMTSFTDAFLMSAITITTIGYGAPTAYFGSCPSIPTIVTTEGFAGMVFHAIIIGTIFAKSQRGITRGQSVAYSKQCLVRIHDGQPYLIFRIVETRKLQLVEAHVRLYAICDEVCPITGNIVQGACHQMRLTQPSDELGGMLLLLLPSRVIHHIDAWSPLLPQSRRDPMGGSAMNSYRYPQIRLRAMDAMQGNRAIVESEVTGEAFSTERAFTAHHTRERVHQAKSMIDPWADMADADLLEELKRHFEDSAMEILVVVEGIDPTCSQTLQSCYSYRAGDFLFNTHDYGECVQRTQKGNLQVNFDNFNDIVQLS